MSQFLNNVPGSLQLSYRQETQCIATQCDARLSRIWRKVPRFQFTESTQNTTIPAQRPEKESGLTGDSSDSKDGHFQQQKPSKTIITL